MAQCRMGWGGALYRSIKGPKEVLAPSEAQLKRQTEAALKVSVKGCKISFIFGLAQLPPSGSRSAAWNEVVRRRRPSWASGPWHRRGHSLPPSHTHSGAAGEACGQPPP